MRRDSGGRRQRVGNRDQAGHRFVQCATAVTNAATHNRPAIKPNTKMRGLTWNKVPNNKVDGSVWAKVDDTKIEVDKTALEDLFGVAERAAPTSTPGAAASVSDKPQTISLLVPKRVTNVSIMLTIFSKMSNADARMALTRLDEGPLTLEQAKALLKDGPQPDEVEVLQSYDGDETLLGKPERFFREILLVPRLHERLRFEVMRRTFDLQVGDVKSTITLVHDACGDVLDSKAFLKMLEVVLAVGNYINGGTFRGGAWGFKIDALTKLTETKASNPRLTLLNYLVDFVEQKHPDALSFMQDLARCSEAARISLVTTLQELRDLTTAVNELDAELKEVQQLTLPPEDRFLAVMTPFAKEARQRVVELAELEKKREAKYKTLGEFLGEEKMPPEELFGLLATFVTSFEKAVLANRAEREKAEKAAARVSGKPAGGAAAAASPKPGDGKAAQAGMAAEAQAMLARLRKT